MHGHPTMTSISITICALQQDDDLPKNREFTQFVQHAYAGMKTGHMNSSPGSGNSSCTGEPPKSRRCQPPGDKSHGAVLDYDHEYIDSVVIPSFALERRDEYECMLFVGVFYR